MDELQAFMLCHHRDDFQMGKDKTKYTREQVIAGCNKGQEGTKQGVKEENKGRPHFFARIDMQSCSGVDI